MERQAKDGTFYQQVGQDDWVPVTRAAKDGTVYKKVGQDDWAPLEPPKVTAGDKSMAALEGFSKSSSLGTLPYLQAAGSYVSDFAAEKLAGAEENQDTYSQRVEKFKDRSEEIKEKAPGYAMAGELAGILTPGVGVSKMVGAGAKALAGSSKLASAVSKSGNASKIYEAARAAKAAGNLEEAAKLVSMARGDLALQGLKLGAEGAILGAAYTPESGFSDVGERIENAGVGALTGAVTPAALRGAGNVVRGAVQAPAYIGKKMLSSFGGVSSDVIEKYLQNPERIRNAKSFDELYETVTGVVNNLSDDLDNSKMTYEAAKKELDEVALNIKESRVEGKAKALEGVQRARATLEESFNASKRGLEQKASSTNVEPLVSDSIQGLKKKVIQGSGEAFDLLDDAPKVETEKLFHGSFNEFDPKEIRPSKGGRLGKGFYMAKSKDAAANYGDKISSFDAKKGKYFDSYGKDGFSQAKEILDKHGIPNNFSKGKYTDPFYEMKQAIQDFAKSKGNDKIYGTKADTLARGLLRKEGFDGIKGFQNNEEFYSVFKKENLFKQAEGSSGVSLSKTHTALTNQIAQLSERGSSSAKQAVSKLKEYSDLIFNKGATDAAGEFKLPSKEIKRIIQDLDADIDTWNAAGGSFDDPYNQGLKKLRHHLDDTLKSHNPNYKKKMVDVAEDAGLLGQVSEKFGKPDRALARLNNIAKPSSKYELEMLQKLGGKSGGDLPKALNEMVDAQKTLKSPVRMETLKASLPEQKLIRESEMAAAAAKRLSKPSQIKESIQKSAANFKAQEAKAQMAQKKELYNRLKSWGEQSAEGKLQQVARGKLYAEKTLKQLSELADEDLVEAVKAAGDAAAFDKTMFNGSRNVNLWATLGAVAQSAGKGGAAGGVVGGIVGGPVGLALGAMTGGMIDVYGPKITKKILDGVIKIKGPITEKALNAIDIPPEAKRRLIQGFKAEFMGGNVLLNASERVKNVADTEPKKGPNKWANDGLEKLKAKDASGVLDQETIDKLKSSKEGQSLLIKASDFSDDAKQLEKILEQIKSKHRGGREISSQEK